MDEKNKLRDNFSENEIEKTPGQGEESDYPVLKLTPEMKERLKKRIQQYEEERERTEKIYAQLSEEDLEALRLGKELQARRRKAAEPGEIESFQKSEEKEAQTSVAKHNHTKKKKRTDKKTAASSWKKNGLAVAAGIGIVLVTTSSFAIASVGGPKQALEVAREMFEGRTRIVVNSSTGEDEPKASIDGMEEEKAYQQIKNELGFDPVRLGYLPPDVEFEQINIDRYRQNVDLYYKGKNNIFTYSIQKYYSLGKAGIDIEDELLDTWDETVEEVEIKYYEYWIKDVKIKTYMAEFEVNDTWYCIMGVTEKDELEKIIKNLIFF